MFGIRFNIGLDANLNGDSKRMLKPNIATKVQVSDTTMPNSRKNAKYKTVLNILIKLTPIFIQHLADTTF